jgi:glycosyltransferase involved in cell wall biosynthesis
MAAIVAPCRHDPVRGAHASTIARVKVLLVSFYFPPAGGGGVQRPLKLAQYLPALGFETHVLAPDDPRWIHRDPELRVPTQAWVHRARYLGPSGRKPAEELHGKQGVERALVQARLASRRLLVPDVAVAWNLTAIPAAIRLARRHGIDAVITTSPPNSVHLVGAAVKRATGARWLADLRDSVVAHPHKRVERVAVRAKEKVDQGVALVVARHADAIACVSEAIAEETRELDPRGPVVTIPNGCDFDDFAGLAYVPGERFRITHTGSFFGKRDPRPFLQAVADSGLDVTARFLGDFRASDREWAESLGLGDRLELVPYAPRATALELQRASEALLLLIPDAGGRGRGVLSGKVFEYLAAARPILAAVPPDGAAAGLIRETGAGVVAAPDDVDGLRAALEGLAARFRAEGLPDVVLAEGDRRRLSRLARVEETAELLRSLA